MAYRSARPYEFDSSCQINRQLLLTPHFFKREEYKGEREVRFATSGPGSDLILDLPPADWITRLRLNPKLQSSEVEAIKSIVQSVLPNVECEPSDLLSGGERSILNEAGLSSEMDKGNFTHRKAGNDGIPECLRKD